MRKGRAVPNDERPLYEQIADDVRQRIESGEFKPGEPITPELELASHHGVSRQTVRVALKKLADEGLLTSGKGRGHRVRDDYAPLQWHLSRFEATEHRGDNPASAVDAWAADVERQGRKPHQDISVSLALPPPRVAERLQIGPEETVVIRHRFRLVDGTPYQLSDSYFPEPLVRGTPLMEPRDVYAPGGLLSAIGHPQAEFLDEIFARMPTRAETDRLRIPGATPVIEHIRTGYAEDGTPLRVMVTLVPADRHSLAYRIRA